MSRSASSSSGEDLTVTSGYQSLNPLVCHPPLGGATDLHAAWAPVEATARVNSLAEWRRDCSSESRVGTCLVEQKVYRC